MQALTQSDTEEKVCLLVGLALFWLQGARGLCLAGACCLPLTPTPLPRPWSMGLPMKELQW